MAALSKKRPQSRQRSVVRITVICALCMLAMLLNLFSTLFLFAPSDDGDNRKEAMLFPSDNGGPIKIAHVISLITCAKAERVRGFLDALIVLRHSIHQNSVHAHQNSSYSYQMFAVIHAEGSCVEHAPLLQRLGYLPLIRDTPINKSKITSNKWYRDHVGNENCCGELEFIKLYAYQLTDYPVVVHWDLDVAVLQPMDDLFDSMLYDKNSVKGQAARQRLQLQPPMMPGVSLPDRIDAFITRDVTSAKPWERVRAVQGGFVVARPNKEHFRIFQEFIMEANYTPGRGPTSGWGGMGYGGFQGAMAYQGVLAYFYDQIYPGHAVELDVCRWNQVVADVIYRGPEKSEMIGQCRQYPVDGNFVANTPENGGCEDCRMLPIEETRTVHYTACRKPWECAIPYPRTPGEQMQAHTSRLQELTNVTTCGILFRKYFEIRHAIESKIATSRGVPYSAPTGTFEPAFFGGYCEGRRGRYIPMEELPEDFTMQQVYGF